MPVLDLQEDRDLSHVKTKTCVVGSGPAGATLALELAESGIDVVVLELGHLGSNTNMHGLEQDTANKFGCAINWSSQLGGSSNIWAGRLGELQPVDFEKRDWVPESGWPFLYDEISPYYTKAKKIIKMPDAYLDIKNPFSRFRELETKYLLKVIPPFNFKPCLLEAASNKSNLRIFMNANVTKLELDENGNRIIAVEVKKPDQSVVKVASEVFVLAMGGVYTPHLMLNSNDKHQDGIGNAFDNVGRYLSTHPKGEVAVLNLNKAIPTQNAIFGKYHNSLGLEASQQSRLKLLNYSFDLVPLYPFKINAATEELFKKYYLDSPFIDKHKYLLPFNEGVLQLLKEQIRRVFNTPKFCKNFMLTGHFDQYPNRENRLKLGYERNEHSMRKMKVQWRFTDEDRTSVLRYLEELDRVLKKDDFGSIDYNILTKMEQWPLNCFHGHHMGTTRMGIDPKTSVTDQNCKVWSLQNLYISGPSLFPTYGYSNPFLTIVALSARLADHLKTKFHE